MSRSSTDSSAVAAREMTSTVRPTPKRQAAAASSAAAAAVERFTLRRLVGGFGGLLRVAKGQAFASQSQQGSHGETGHGTEDVRRTSAVQALQNTGMECPEVILSAYLTNSRALRRTSAIEMTTMPATCTHPFETCVRCWLAASE